MTNVLSYLQQWDHDIFFLFQRIQCPALDAVLGFPTILGETFFLLSAVTVLILCLDRDKPAEKIMICTVALLLTCWVVIYLKDFFGRPRPAELWHGVARTFGKAGGPAFPSGHTAAVFAAAYILNKLYAGKMPWLYAVAAWVGVTRIYTGVHYPTDIPAGAVVGIACAALTQWILNIRKKGLGVNKDGTRD